MSVNYEGNAKAFHLPTRVITVHNGDTLDVTDAESVLLLALPGFTAAPTPAKARKATPTKPSEGDK